MNTQVKESTTKDKFHFGIAFSCIMYCVLNVYLYTNAHGLFFAPCSEYLGVGRAEFSLYYSFQGIITMIALLFSGNIMSKYRKNLKLILIIAALLQCASHWIYSFGTSMMYWYIGAVFIGIGNAFATLQLVGLLANNWFKVGAGTLIGVSMALNSLVGAVIAPFITTQLATDAEAFRMVYRVVGTVCAVGIIPCVIAFVRYSPAEAGKLPYGWSKVKDDVEKAKVITGVSEKRAYKNPSFYMLFIMTMLFCGWASFATNLPGFAQSLGYDALVVGIVASCQLVGGCIGKFGLGALSDKIGVFKASLLAVVIGIVGMVMFILNINLTFYMFGGVCFGVSTALVGITAPVMTRRYYGERDYGPIYAKINIAIWLGSSVCIPIYNLFYDHTGSYAPGLIVAMAYIVVGYILSVIGDKTAKKLPRE